MALFGVSVETEDDTEFYAVVADHADGARVFVSQALPHVIGGEIEVRDLEVLLDEQYEGLALLGTT